MSRCQGHDSPAGGAGGHLRPGVTSLADQVTAGALPDPRDLRLPLLLLLAVTSFNNTV